MEHITVITDPLKYIGNADLLRKYTQLAHECRYAMVRAGLAVAGELTEPISSDPKSFEAILHHFASRLPKKHQDTLVTRSREVLANGTAMRRKFLGEFASANAKTTSVDRANVARPRFTAADLAEIAMLDPDEIDVTPQPISNGSNHTKVQLRINRVRCFDETDGFFFSEGGADEIYLGGFKLNPDGSKPKVGNFKVMNFDESVASRTKKDYNPPKVFAEFNLSNNGNHWPKIFGALLILVESEELGPASETYSEIWQELSTKLADELESYLLSQLGSKDITQLIMFMVAGLFTEIADMFDDDIAPPIFSKIKITHPGYLFPGNKTVSKTRAANVKWAGGEYGIRWHYRLV